MPPSVDGARRSRTAAPCRTGRTPTRTRRAGSTSAPPPGSAAGGGGPGRRAGRAAARRPRAPRTWSAGRSPRRTSSCRRARTASAGRPRSRRASAAWRRSASLPTVIAAWATNGPPGSSVRSAMSSSATMPRTSERALQEQRRPSTASADVGGEARAAAVGVPDHGTRAAISAASATGHLDQVAAGGRERLDEHADAGGAEQDQHRRQRRVVELRRVAASTTFALPPGPPPDRRRRVGHTDVEQRRRDRRG